MSRSISFIVAIILIAGGCTKKSNPLSPPAPTIEFPPDTKFSLTLYSPSSVVSVGQSFDVRVVLYNVSGVSGMALDVSYPAANVDVVGVTNGTDFFPQDSVVSLSKIDADSGRVEFGISYKNTSSAPSKSGSGIACTFKCKAKASGSAAFIIDQTTLQINTPAGTLINGFGALLVENLTIPIGYPAKSNYDLDSPVQ